MGEKRLPKKAEWYRFIEIQDVSNTSLQSLPRPVWTKEEKTRATGFCTRLEDRLGAPTLQVATPFSSRELRTYTLFSDLILYHAFDYLKETLELQLQSKDVDAPDFRIVQQKIEKLFGMKATQQVQFHNGEDNNAELTKDAMLWVPLSRRRKITQNEFGELIEKIGREYVPAGPRITIVSNIPARHAQEMGLSTYKITGYKTIQL